MAEFAKDLLELAPTKGGPRDTMRLLINYAVLAAISVAGYLGTMHAVDTRVQAKVEPVRIRVYETQAVIDQLFDDAQEIRIKQGLPTRSRAELKMRAHQAARDESETP